MGYNREGKPTEVTIHKIQEDVSFIKEDFEDLYRELAKPSLIEGPEKSDPYNEKEVDD